MLTSRTSLLSALRLSSMYVIISLISAVIVLLAIMNNAIASEGRSNQTKAITFMRTSFTVPFDWVSFRSTGMLVAGPPAEPGALSGTRLTFEAFKARGAKAPAIDTYYRGPWRTVRSTFGLPMRLSTKVRKLRVSKDTIIVTEYVDIPETNLGIGLSAFSTPAAGILKLGTSVLMTARLEKK